MGGLGFKDLQKFNEALLAKQVWHLLEDKPSLFHRFFKSKFFPRGSIFDAKEGRGSFAWKSILKSRELIKKGSQWRVGNGENIPIYGAKWLPDPQYPEIQSAPTFFGEDAKVSILIDKERKCWIEEVIDNNFLVHEARLIKAIPLSLFEVVDKLYWYSNLDGLYSVKGGYKLLMSEDQNSNVVSSPGSLPKSSWRSLWKLNTPNRVKTLLWRAISNALPTRANLVKRKVLTDPTCQACGLAPETSLHALWSCLKLSNVWALHFNLLKNEASGSSSFRDVFQLCVEKSHPLDLFAMISYQIWFRRNRVRLGEVVEDLKLVNTLAKDALQEFQQANLAPLKSSPAQSIPKWVPPPSGWVKANFDGAIFQDRDAAGLGIIIRNDYGLVMAALTQIIPLPTSVETVEVLAARRAVIFAFELGFDQVILEGDSAIAIQALNSDDFSAAPFGHIISDVKSFSPCIRSLIFCHTLRLGNKVAHRLAREACNFSFPFCTWIKEVPVSSYAEYSAEIVNT